MEYHVLEQNGRKYIATCGDGKLASERDALDLLAACGENDAAGVLLRRENLGEDFYRLRTGLAGCPRVDAR